MALALTKHIPAPAPILRSQQLNGATSIAWEDNDTISSISSAGIYSDSFVPMQATSTSINKSGTLKSIVQEEEATKLAPLTDVQLNHYIG